MNAAAREPKHEDALGRSTEHERHGASRRRIVALAALWASISAAALLAPGCYGNNCEGGFETFGADTDQGYMVDENTWASNRWNETWLWFPRQRYYIFDIKALGGRTPEKVLPYISASPNPNKDNNNAVIAAGNLGEIYQVGPNRVDVRNDSCSDYYLRLVVEVPPQPPEAPADAGETDADTGIFDASAGGDAEADGGDAEAGP